MIEKRPLPIYSAAETVVDMASIKAAKAQLDLDFLVVPVAATPDTAERVLAVGSKPPWVWCDYALVSERTKPEGLVAALSWVLGDEDHPRATTTLDTMVSIFGPGTVEISAEQLAAEEQYRLYLSHQD